MGHEQEDSLLTGILLHKMRKILKYGSFLLAVAVAAGILAGCSKKAVEVESLPQYDTEVAEGEQIAVMTIRDYGTIKIRFFKEQAPKAVENFITHAKQGYYNELNFHRVIENFMIQGGDPKADGSGGESIWDKPFEDEFAPELRNFYGALSMANSGENSNGSQFFIVQNKTQYTDKELDAMEKEYDVKLAKKVREKYKEVGGTPWLDDAHTVFGQVFEGMDVVDKIAQCKVTYRIDSSGQQENTPSKPVNEVLIEKVEIQEYHK